MVEMAVAQDERVELRGAHGAQRMRADADDDARIVAVVATQVLGDREDALGITCEPPLRSTQRHAARIGVPQTRHLALTAARFKGPVAYRLGIAHHLVKVSAALDDKPGLTSDSDIAVTFTGSCKSQ